jgi:hypothetical protein
MSEPREDVLNKLDALLKKHTPTEPDIPVLTDLVEQPRVDLDLIPVLTEEIELGVAATPHPAVDLVAPEEAPQVAQTPVAEQGFIAEPTTPLELNLVHESSSQAPPQPDGPESVLARLEAVEAEVQAEIEARIAQTRSAPSAPPSIEIPQDATYIPLPSNLATEPVAPPLATPSQAQLPPAHLPPAHLPPAHLPEDTAKQIAALIEADIARMIKNNLRQALAEDLSGMLNSALDKALSSMLEQFMLHMEEVVRNSIADEFKKQLAPFKRPAPPNKP